MSTYCISDIHGQWSNFKRFLDTLNKDDEVYVLGDVIDRGNNSIKLLQYIMLDNRFHMLLGNHEYMMFNCLTSDPASFKRIETQELWCDYNCGQTTMDQFFSLDNKERNRILEFIKGLPITIPNLKVGDKTFYLVHSNPYEDLKVKMRDLDFDEDEITKYLWERVTPFDKFEIQDKIIIAGHTIVQEYLGLFVKEVEPVYDYKNYFDDSKDKNTINKAHYIDIDGGLSTSLPNAKLIALCLDDLSYNLY